MTDAPADLVITGCTALVHCEQEAIEFLDDATIVVRDGVIESVTAGPGDADAAAGVGERIDARGQVAMPGLINCHTHAPMVTLVHSARSSDVRTTIVDGRILMRDRELRTIDVPAVVKEMGS